MSVRRLAPLSAWMAITAALCWAPAALAECPGTEGGRHRRGDLKSITTPDGKVTWFTDYNAQRQRSAAAQRRSRLRGDLG